MRPPRLLLALCLCGLAATHESLADESQLALPADADTALVRSRCTGCHSIDYIQMNSPFLKRASWEAEVTKMIKVYGAPVSTEEATRVVDYLVRHYGVKDGTDKAASTPRPALPGPAPGRRTGI